MSVSIECPACHNISSEPDFCSSCGAAIAPAAEAAPSAGAPSQVADQQNASSLGAGIGAENCPVCNSLREDPSSDWCGTCGYNYATGKGGEVYPDDDESAEAAAAVNEQVQAPGQASVQGPGAVSSAGDQTGPRLDLHITVDYSKPGAPSTRPGLTFPLFDEESLIGRSNSSVKQTVAIDDPAVSKRHALIVRTDGSFIIRDLNSMNGTSVNGTALLAGADQPLNEGDVITLGEFTIITIKAIRL